MSAVNIGKFKGIAIHPVDLSGMEIQNSVTANLFFRPRLDQRIFGGISQERIHVGIFPIVAFETQESSIGKAKESFLRPCFHRKTAGIRTLAQS
jgi:hypothetical protein